MNRLVLLRHGQSQWNLENRFTGFKDIDITAQGEAEAKRAGNLLRGIKFDHLFTSTLKRAWRTAEIALAEMGQKIPETRHDDLRERDYGDLTGLNKDELRTKYGEDQVHIWRRSYEVQPPGGESLEDVVNRVGPYYREHIEPMLKQGKNVLMAAHGNTLRAMLIVLGEYTPENISKAEFATGVPFVVEFDKGQRGRFYEVKEPLAA